MITITAPKKGLGQTVTAINIATEIGNMLKKRVLLIDINQYCCSVDGYLSNALWTKGLDEFKNSIEAGVYLNALAFQSLCKGITPRLNIMASNEYFQLDKKDIEKLHYYTEEGYPVTLIDSIAGKNQLTDHFVKHSKIVVVILNQDQSLIRLIKERNLYGDIKEKVIFVINRNMESHNGLKVKYGLKEISLDLRSLGFTNGQIYSLPFDVELLNECNDYTLLNYSLSPTKETSQYHIQITKLTRDILKSYGDFQFEGDCVQLRKKRAIFNFF